jgi:hypothetical protein
LNGLLCGVESGFQKLPGISTGVFLLEYGAAGDKDLGTGTHYAGDGLVIDAAVNFNAEAESARLPDIREQLNLLQGGVDKGLPPEAGIHAHDENMMNKRKNLIDGVDRCGRVYDHSRRTSVRSDEMKRAIKMGASFLVNRDPIDSCFGEHRDKFVLVFDHKVTVDRNRRYSAERGDNRRPDREIGDEVAVHYVNVENGRSPSTAA